MMFGITTQSKARSNFETDFEKTGLKFKNVSMIIISHNSFDKIMPCFKCNYFWIRVILDFMRTD